MLNDIGRQSCLNHSFGSNAYYSLEWDERKAERKIFASLLPGTIISLIFKSSSIYYNCNRVHGKVWRIHHAVLH